MESAATELDHFLRLCRTVLPEYFMGLSEQGLLLTDVRLLTAIWRTPGLRYSDVSPPTLTGRSITYRALRRLVERGFIRRVDNPQRRGSYHLYLTPAAQDVMDYWPMESMAPLMGLFTVLSAEERRTFFLLCRKLAEGMGPSQRPSWWDVQL